MLKKSKTASLCRLSCSFQKCEKDTVDNANKRRNNQNTPPNQKFQPQVACHHQPKADSQHSVKKAGVLRTANVRATASIDQIDGDIGDPIRVDKS